MSRRSIVALTAIAVFAVALFFGGQHLWNALLVMHGQRPH
jgi:hypothetical protein